jgi:predicted transcriptional regulator
MTASSAQNTANDVHLLKTGTTMNVRVTPELQAAIDKMAEQERVTKSVAIRMLIVKGLRERNLIK